MDRISPATKTACLIALEVSDLWEPHEDVLSWLKNPDKCKLKFALDLARNTYRWISVSKQYDSVAYQKEMEQAAANAAITAIMCCNAPRMVGSTASHAMIALQHKAAIDAAKIARATAKADAIDKFKSLAVESGYKGKFDYIYD